jgi:hypothetical protein
LEGLGEMFEIAVVKILVASDITSMSNAIVTERTHLHHRHNVSGFRIQHGDKNVVIAKTLLWIILMAR